LLLLGIGGKAFTSMLFDRRFVESLSLLCDGVQPFHVFSISFSDE
jgi:hypothetical protein